MPATGTYMSETVYHEDGYGNVTERVVVATYYDDLFISSADYLALQDFTDIIKIGSSKKDVALETGSYAQDELTIKMDQASIETAIDQNCYELVLQAQDTAYPLYIGYFIQPDDSDTLTNDAKLIASAEFIGIIQPDMKAKEVFWRNKTEYDPDTQPLYEWDLKAKSFDLSSFDADSLEDLLMNVSDGLFQDTAWRSANISDRLGYCDLGGGKTTKFANLVNLNTALTEISSILAARLSDRLNQIFTIVIDSCTLDIKYSPARWYNGIMQDLSDPPNITYKRTRFVRHDIPTTPGETHTDFYRVNASDQQTVKFGDGTADADSIFISSFMMFWRDINAGSAGDGSPQKNKLNSFVEKEDITFADFMIALAANFGLIVRFAYSTATELHVQFMSRTEYIKEYCFIPDVTESDLTTSQFKKSDAAKPTYGRACQWADEGDGKQYRWNNSGGPTATGFIEEAEPPVGNEGDKLILTISPTVRQQFLADSEDVYPPDFTGKQNFGIFGAHIPHNAIICLGDTRRDDSKYCDAIWNSIGLHTAIYLKCTGIEDDDFSDITALGSIVNLGVDGDAIWSPAAAGHYKFNGVEMPAIYKQADYVNFIRGLDDQAYTTERNLTVPYLCRFRKTQAGTDADDDGGRGRWQNVGLGSKITFGTGGTAVTYIVVGIERDSEKKETKLKLWNSSYFAFSAAAGLTSAVDVESSVYALPTITQKQEHYIASGTIGLYSVVMQNSDGTYSKALPAEANVGKICGIAMNGAADGEDITVLKPGETYYNPAYSYAVRTPLYLRNLVSVADNISDELLEAKAGAEDMALLIGYATGGTVETTNFDNIDNQIILEV